jgi:hypothetical protein
MNLRVLAPRSYLVFSHYLFICILFNDTASNSDNIESNDILIMNDELERMWGETVVDNSSADKNGVFAALVFAPAQLYLVKNSRGMPPNAFKLRGHIISAHHESSFNLLAAFSRSLR